MEPVTISCYAVGSVYGTLDVDKRMLTTDDLTIKVGYNKSFGSWLRGLSDKDKEYWKVTPQTFPALPRTYKYPPYIGYELIGVNRQNDDRNGFISVLGQIVNHNPTYGCALIRVHKRPDASFVLMIEGDFYNLAASSKKEVDANDLTGCWAQIQAKRVGHVFSLRHGRILATKDDNVVLRYSFREDYFSVDMMVKEVNLEENTLLAVPANTESKTKLKESGVTGADNGLILVTNVSSSFRYSDELADYLKNFEAPDDRVLKIKVRKIADTDTGSVYLKCRTMRLL